MNVLELQHVLAHLPDSMPVVCVGGPDGHSRCTWLLVDGVTVAVRVCDIMVWARVGDEYLGLVGYQRCARTQWTSRDDQPDRPPAPRTPAAIAAIVADVARRALTHDG